MNETVAAVSTKRTLKREKTKKYKQYRALLIMMIPAIVYYIIFHYLPMIGVLLAFKDFKITQGILGSPWAGFHHFEKIIHDSYFYTVLKNTIVISLYKLVFGFPVPIVFALLLSEISNLKFKKVVQTVSYLPHFISWVVLAGIFFTIFSLDGPINAIVKLFGGDPMLYLADDRYFRTILVVTSIFQGFGWGSIIYFAAISSIDPQLYEAAVIDGAGRFKRMIYISIPMLVPIIAIMLILSMSGILDAGFDQIFNMYNAKVYNVSDIIDTYVYRKGLIELNYSYATAVGLFKSVVALFLIIAVNRIVKWIGGKEHAIW
ncbi:ABC transporter permease subunit [Paenibacillus alginolyticus]|uniref:ABC transporter permease subunit n=1 Tax=Paenibacillus alginolyticus TaxID=59839 RepID=A0ABT4GBN5_9BACL|nr:ABC transporter permease subunit [Paenibacillus alginolyticus]MCY9670096.1 ABC transporter permease subunit [Paenibacillus alginolyticus]MCY9693578.1 ABC transporter permease subunit [Paenibacillus alginolyticus]MEC0146671.1 ABC transporter permease subunit [Paenibacillus alginolyticus]